MKVKLNKVPGWLAKAMRKRHGGRDSAWRLMWDHNSDVLQHPWFDHWGEVDGPGPFKDSGGSLVSQPYSIGEPDIPLILEFAKRYDLQFVITGGAEWNGDCCSILFKPRSENN